MEVPLKAIQITRHGEPADVLEIIDLPEPGAPGAGEVLIEMLYSPINPFDLRIVRGIVPGPALPSRLGSEGVGIVLAVGEAVSNVAAGDRVHVPLGHFAWQERLVVPAKSLFPLSATAAAQQLAMLRVNPPTAALCLSEFVDLQPGDWVVQNGGTSAVARGVIAIAKARGLRTVSIVRRPEAIDEVRAAGGDIVLLAGEGIAAAISEAIDGAQVKLGLDGIGGPSMAMVSGAISPGGTLVVYSAMSLQPGVANQLDIIFRDISIRGFWLAYPRIHVSGAFDAAVREGAGLIAEGKLHVPIAAVYPLSELREAVMHADRGPKVLLKLH